MSIFLVTILSCNQVQSVVNRLLDISMLTPQQKTEIVLELKKVVPSCPVIIKSNETRKII